jgi:hypothetical protein
MNKTGESKRPVAKVGLIVKTHQIEGLPMVRSSELDFLDHEKRSLEPLINFAPTLSED